MDSDAARLRALIKPGQPLLAPGAPNALTARIIEDVGFDAVYVSGAGVANAFLGQPDLGLLGLNELVDHVAAIRDAVSVPLIVDADTGFGNPLNVRRTIRLLERAGANAVQLEDQAFPKRCGHFAGKQVVPLDEMVAKIHSAVDARRSPDLLVIARTDARAQFGFDLAIERAAAYLEAGADVSFVEAPQTAEEVRAVPQLLAGPQLINMVEGGKTPLFEFADLAEMGYAVVLYANAPLRAAMRAMQRILTQLREQGSTTAALDEMVSWEERQRLVQKPRFDELEHRFGVRQ